MRDDELAATSLLNELVSQKVIFLGLGGDGVRSALAIEAAGALALSMRPGSIEHGARLPRHRN